MTTMPIATHPPGRFGRVLRFVTHYWLLSPVLFGVLMAARIGSTLIDVFVPIASGQVVDAIASGAKNDAGPALRALSVLLALVALFQVSRQGVSFLLNRLSARAITAIGRDAFAKAQRFSADWHANSFAGATVRKITRGMNAFDTFTDVLAFNLAPALIVVTGVTATFVWRWAWLGVAVGAAISFFVAVSVVLSLYWVSPANRAAREWDSKMSGALADAVSGNATVKSFAAEPREDADFAAIAGMWASRSVISWDRSAWVALIQSAMLLVLQAMMLGGGVLLWTEGRATPGDVTSLIATQFLISSYLRDIAMNVRQLQRTLNDMDDVLAFRDAEPDVVDRPNAPALRVGPGRIEFDAAAFRYKGASAALYDSFDLVIPPGQRVGLVGHSGSGKSTFVKLLQRLHDLDAGAIRIDGQNIAGVTQTSLREAIGLVPQDPVLFHRTLAENIAYSRPGASTVEIARAARLARAADFIEALPQGYETLVGERGVKLSGGERQRVAIARAILADPEILVLDEATSSLDSVAERQIRAAIDELSAGRTTIIIAHRLSTVRRLDRILVFERGRIVEDGSHEALMARPGGVYRRLVEVQIGDDDLAAAAE